MPMPEEHTRLNASRPGLFRRQLRHYRRERNCVHRHREAAQKCGGDQQAGIDDDGAQHANQRRRQKRKSSAGRRPKRLVINPAGSVPEMLPTVNAVVTAPRKSS